MIVLTGGTPPILEIAAAQAQSISTLAPNYKNTIKREAASSISANRFVRLNSTNHFRVEAVTSASDVGFGVVDQAYTTGQQATVITDGTVYAETGGAITIGDLVKLDSSGRVVTIGSLPTQGRIVGDALADASTNGQYVLVNLKPGIAYGQTLAAPNRVSKTSDYTIVEGTDASGTVFDNSGAAGTVTLSLPAAAADKTTYSFVNTSGNVFRVDPGASDGIYVSGAKQSDGAYLELASIGSSATLIADASGDWMALVQGGDLLVQSVGLPAMNLRYADVVDVTQAGSPYDITGNSKRSGTYFTNYGATATVTYTLPSAPLKGTTYTFYAEAAYELRIDPGSNDGIYVSGALQSDGKYVAFDAVGETITLVADARANWMATGFDGTFSVEP